MSLNNVITPAMLKLLGEDGLREAAQAPPNRLWYVWTEGHMGATGEGPSGPQRHGPVLAASEADAIEKIKPKLSSWAGTIKLATTNENYAPRQRWEW